ncbi:hypothetical protein GCM10022281_06040 [Sphingomonas rosea]|uniref:Protein TonB n=1 Tax=Sphingomonas rosea TaxID=335605 RepID=A0ABP7TQ34_9SPHN
MPWQPRRSDRRKSLALVIALHVALGTALVIGLAVQPLARRVPPLVTFDVLPPIRPTPPTEDRKEGAKERAGAADREAKPAPVVLPQPSVRLPAPTPLATADDKAPETAAAPSAGASAKAGPGQGAGGSGTGVGGGGTGGAGIGAGAGLGSEARLLSGNLTRGDYRRIRNFGALRGQAVLALEVGPAGRLTRCTPLASSGDGALDEELCRLLARTRWEPARDRAGLPVPVSLRYVATWDRD